jgi:transposase
MNNICELKQQFISLKQAFNENVQDKFGNSINDEILEPTLNNFNLLCIQEEKIKAEKVVINRYLLEAKSILPII